VLTGKQLSGLKPGGALDFGSLKGAERQIKGRMFLFDSAKWQTV
jgi:hypothetical protein